MVKCGIPPYLECSSKGDKRFSAFYARIQSMHNKSIEELYQAAKVFEDGSTGLSIKDAKGKQAINMDVVAKLYSELWDLYFQENPSLYEVFNSYEGFSDTFGQAGHQCQATEIYRIWVNYQLRNLPANMEKYKHLVVSKHSGLPYDEYCGRGSEYGNEYSHNKNSKALIFTDTVEQAIAHYRFKFLIKWKLDSDFRVSIKKLKGKVTCCYCSNPSNPKPCHCFVIVAAANMEESG